MNIFLMIALLLLGVLFAHMLPLWTRPDLFFAVTIDPAFRRTPEAFRILRLYRLIVWIGTLGAIGLATATGFMEFSVLCVAGFLIALALAHRQTLPHAVEASPILEVNLSAPAEAFPGGLLIVIPPLASLVALAWWAQRHWEQLPAKVPVHWGNHGADRFVERTAQGIYGLIAVHAAICLGMLLMAWGILHWSRRVFTSGAPAAAERRFRRLNVLMMILVSYFAAAQPWMLLLRPQAMGNWWGLLLLAVLLPFLALVVRNTQAAPSIAPVGDHTPDSCWKLGMFYINPGDPSIFVAKRFGFGYTVNFGNRWSWALMGVILAALFARSVLK